MNPKFAILFFLLFVKSAIIAQTVDSIIFVPDRPGMTTPPDILTFEKLQLETGFGYENYDDGTIPYENYLMPSFLIRFGLVKNAEGRISTNYCYKTLIDSGISSQVKGLDPITIGTKFKLFKQRKILPKTSVLINMTLPWYGKSEFVPLYLAPSISLLMSNSIYKKLTVSYNYGLIWDGNRSPITQYYTLALGLNILKKLNIFIEGYGYSSKYKRARLYYKGGLAFLINNHLQFDISASSQLNSSNNYYYVNAGIAWQLARKKLKF